jgi:hypothetical protein
MKPVTYSRNCLLTCLLVISSWTFLPRVQAYPPAPHHVIYGMVRDEMGNPLTVQTADIILETLAGVQVKTHINPSLQAGVNYSLEVPMDSGITSDLYKPTALCPMVPFRIKVQIGQTIYLPIQMKGDYSKLGQPGQRTRIDLTLGEDADGDGIPDAWERALIARLGLNVDIKDIRPDGHTDGSGLNNLAQYIAGTYAYDSKDGFALKIVRTVGEAAVLEFMSIRGRTYTICGSADMNTWTPVKFYVLPVGPDSVEVQSYYAPDDRVLQAQIIPQNGQPSARFFKLMVQ